MAAQLQSDKKKDADQKKDRTAPIKAANKRLRDEWRKSDVYEMGK